MSLPQLDPHASQRLANQLKAHLTAFWILCAQGNHHWRVLVCRNLDVIDVWSSLAAPDPNTNKGFLTESSSIVGSKTEACLSLKVL